MKPFRGVFSARPYGSELNGNSELRLAGPAPVAEMAPGLVSPQPGPKHLLWEVLVELGFVDEQRVLEAEAVARASRQDLAAVLLERGLVSSEQLARAVAQREGVLFADLETYVVDERAASLITPAVAERYGAIPIGFGAGGEVLLALANPRDRHAVNDISMMVDPSVTRVVATQESIDALIQARKEATYDGAAGEGLADAGSGTDIVEPTAVDDGGSWHPAAEAAATGMVEGEPVADAPAPSAENGASLDAPAATGAQPDEENEWPQGFDAEEHSAPLEEEAVAGPPDGEPGQAPDVFEAPSPEAGGFEQANSALDPPDVEEPSPDREVLESLTRSVEQIHRLLREASRDREAELETAAAGNEQRLSEMRAEIERDRTRHAEVERALRDELEAERAARDEIERKLREDAEVERTARERSERGLREELETERAERAESERALREELESERATREALASETAAVRTARDDLARRVASARDLLELGARPFVPLTGRER